LELGSSPSPYSLNPSTSPTCFYLSKIYREIKKEKNNKNDEELRED
jgi:hypothetical protein